MCGIIGYIGDKNAAVIGIDCLKKLEYRGYDSAGIATLNENKIEIRKDKGKIGEIREKLRTDDMKGNIAILHTRWATHGEPTAINAHPHSDCKGEIAIVHNGIIENYYTLKELLEKEGHKFISETDSEVIAHLIEKFYLGNLEEAVFKALKNIEGAYGLAVIHKNEEKIIAARRGSPLIIGIGDNEMFIASDIAAILKHTKKIIHLHDNEIASISKNNFYVKNLDNEKIDKEVDEITWTIDQIEKKGYPHFMLKEIFEQPDSIKNTLRGRVKDKIKITTNIDINSVNRIIITACGTSWHSALVGKYILEELAGIPVEVDYASEFRYRNPLIKKSDIVIAISQSGETADTLAAIKEAKLKNAKTFGIVNVVGSSIAREVDSGIYLHAGPEIGVASTKAFTSQLIAIILLALYLRQEKNLSIQAKILDELKEIPGKIKIILDEHKKIKEIAEKFKDAKNFLYLGRGTNFPVALEGALKLKEISYIHAEGYPAAEMKHGPIALIDENMPVVFIATKNHVYEKILSNMQEVKARKGKIIAIINEDDEQINKLADSIIKVPKTIDIFSPIINIIPLQLLAYYIADLKRIDVDKPRNLAKSVTVE